jgi:hypothetical protein
MLSSSAGRACCEPVLFAELEWKAGELRLWLDEGYARWLETCILIREIISQNYLSSDVNKYIKSLER